MAAHNFLVVDMFGVFTVAIDITKRISYVGDYKRLREFN